MAEVIHTIKGNEYLYEHYRDDDTIRSKYIGPVGKGGNIREAKHGGGAPPRVTQHPPNQKVTVEGSILNKTHELGNGWIMETEDIYVSHMGTTSPAVKYRVLDPVGKEIKTITEQDKIMPDDVDDKFEDVLRPYNKRFELPYRGIVREGGENLTKRDMYYLTGETKENKEQIKQAGFTWEPDLIAWSSIHKPDFEIKGVDVDMKPTYKTKNAWTHYN